MEEARRIADRIGNAIDHVGVFVNPSLDDVARVRELFPAMQVQLSGDESPELAASIPGTVIKAFHVGDDEPRALDAICERYPSIVPLFDTKSASAFGGTGTAFDWARIAPIAVRRRVYVAGGLTPANVGELVRRVKPFGVDVRSGIETNGIKDVSKMMAFVREVRENDAA